MPNKDSFTFSDKLRKSKSVPLSKRLPSIVGGQNKQKRTLVQRAQRDLPFIMVAACALLLLPFLSKNGTDDINTPGEFGWDPTETNTGVINNRPEIMPPDALEDPTKWIIWNPKSDVKGSDVNPEKPNVDSPGNPNRNNPRTNPRGWDDNVGSDNPTYGGTTGGRRNSPERNKTPVKENALGHKQTPPATVSSPAPRKSPTVDRKIKDSEGIDRKIAAKENKPSPTEKFGPQTKPHIRNSVVRKGTEINRQLRLSQMPKNGTGANVSHALPTGQAPVRTSSPSAPNPGVRPVALQPMDARGTVGRSMTGENLYAEAARSINAMNAGRGAKANLLAAQMRDVDGTLTPGAEGGTFGGDGSPRPGAGGGGPNNNNGYKVDKPWWWDMMQTRSQKWWELFQYKWREMLWTNIYDLIFNGGKQIASCLLFGNKDIDVSNMFGKSAGEGDYVCTTVSMMSLGDYVAKFGSSYTHKGKDSDTEQNFNSDNARAEWFKKCPDKADGKEGWQYQPGKRKSALDVRLECLGINTDIFKNNKVYDDDACDGVNNDPMSYTLTITRKGKEIERLEKKTVITLIAQNKDESKPDTEAVVYLESGNTLSDAGSKFASTFSLNYKACKLTKLVSFVSRRSISKVESRTNEYTGDGGYENGLPDPNNTKINENLRNALNDCLGDGLKTPTENHKYVTLESLRNGEDGVKQLGNNKIDPSQARTKKAVDPQDLTYHVCPIIKDKAKITRLTLNEKICQVAPRTPICSGEDCNKKERFTALIENPGKKNVYAFVLEQAKDENGVATNTAVLKDYMNFSIEANQELITKTDVNTYKYSFDYDVFDGASAKATGEPPTMDYSSFTKHDKGRVLWVVTDAKFVKAANNSSFTFSMENVTTKDLFGEDVNAVLKACDYRPPCQGEDCTCDTDELCKDIHDEIFYTTPLIQVQTRYSSATHGLRIPLSKVPEGFLTSAQYSITEGTPMEHFDPSEIQQCTELCYEDGKPEYKNLPQYTSERKVYQKIGDKKHELGTIAELESQLPPGTLTNIKPCDISSNYCRYKEQYYPAFPVTIEGHTYIVRSTTTAITDNRLDNLESEIEDCACFGWMGEPPYAYHLTECRDPQNLPIYYKDDASIIEINNKIAILGHTGLEGLYDKRGNTPAKYPLLPQILDDRGYCKLESDNQWYYSVKLTGLYNKEKHFIIDPNPVDEADVPASYKSNPPQCHIAVWEEVDDSVFTVYDAGYNTIPDPLPIHLRPTLTEIDCDNFEEIKAAALATNNPYTYELFPELVGNVMEKCTIQYQPTYLNNHIEPNDDNSVQQLVEDIDKCFEALAKVGITDRKLYFYGYASTKGDEPGKCATNGSDSTGCNKALSEDRNLYLMKQVTQKSTHSDEIGVGNITHFANFRGFRNTQAPNGESLDRNQRLVSGLSASEQVFNLISRPCGSTGASSNDPGEGRYVFITLLDFDVADYCNEGSRLNENNLKAKIDAFIGPLPLPLSSDDPSFTVIQATGDNQPDGDEDELDPELVQQAEALLARINRTDPLTLSNPVVCNNYIRQINTLLGIAENDGVDLTRGNVTVLRSKMAELSEKIHFHPAATGNNSSSAATGNNSSIAAEQGKATMDYQLNRINGQYGGEDTYRHPGMNPDL